MSNVVKAILKINPNAEVSVKNDDINEIIWENGTTPISKADIEIQIPIVEKEISDAETATANKKASGKQKLKDLGLDDEEIKALIGA
jgi:hypothetical protein